MAETQPMFARSGTCGPRILQLWQECESTHITCTVYIYLGHMCSQISAIALGLTVMIDWVQVTTW